MNLCHVSNIALKYNCFKGDAHMVPVILFHPIYFEEKNVKTSLFAKSSSSNLTLNWETVYLVELNQSFGLFSPC